VRLTHRAWRRTVLILGLLSLCAPPQARGEEDTAGRMIKLPPFIVEDSGPARLHWRYATFSQFEILSVCSDHTTEEFLRELYGLEQQLSAVLPTEFRFHTSLPVTYILCDTSMQQRLDQDIPVQMLLNHGSTAPAAIQSQHFVTIPHLGLQDPDAYMSFVLLDSHFMKDGQMTYLPDAMAYLLRQRTPPLPSWFVSGFTSLYGTWSFTQPGEATILHIMLPNVSPYAKIGGGNLVQIPGESTVGIFSAPLSWISPQEGKLLRLKISSRLANNRPVASLLLPMEDLLIRANPPPGSGPAAERYRRTWAAQAALFVQWALDEQSNSSPESHGPGRARLWRFLTRTSAEPGTEAMFQDCFGLNFDEAREKLGRYFLVASSQTKALGINASDPPSIPVRDATEAEIARIKGDWERLEVGLVKKTFPGLSAAYQEHAHKTLWHEYDLGDRDPRLLAVMGLEACDVGDDAAAKPLLNAATKAHVIRPLAYEELARILYAEAVAQPLGANKKKLSAGQTAVVLAPLSDARKQSPPLLSASELFANVWFQSDRPPSRTELAELDADTVLFPHSASLTFQTAVLEAQAGLIPQANRLIDRGLQNIAEGPGKTRLVQLRTLLVASGTAK
jgi:hypothetical protein